MTETELTHAEEREAIEARLAAIQFADRSQAKMTDAEREAAWQDFYKNAPDDLAYLLDVTNILINTIGIARDAIDRIRHKNPNAQNTRDALEALQIFLNNFYVATTKKGQVDERP